MTTKDDIIKYVQHTPENTNPSVLGGLLSDLQEEKSIQPDWNQNDETAADYVKNRPFYTGDSVETVLEESTAEFGDVGNGFYVATIPFAYSPTVGKTYNVSWDGTVYKRTYQGGGLIGNLSLIDEGSDTGEPFVVFFSEQDVQVGTTDTSASHTFSISVDTGSVVQIDLKYLPFASETEPGIVYIPDLLQRVEKEYFAGTDSQVFGYANAADIKKYAAKNNSYSIFSPGKFSGVILSCHQSYKNKYITCVLSNGAKIECWKFSEGSTAMEKLWEISKDGVVISSSTPDSTKKFKITVDDSGTLTVTECLPQPK